MRPSKAAVALLAVACGLAQAAPGETLAQIKARGELLCGVSEGIAGFSARDSAGRWSGMDADFCRALAAAALRDAGKAKFVPLRASARFPALRVRQVDLLMRNTTWTLEREAGLGVQTAGVLFYDGHGFMVPAKSGVKTPAGLKGATVCVEKGTTSAQRLAGYSAELGLNLIPLVIDSTAGAADAFFAGKCGALTGDVSQLAGVRLRAPGGPQGMAIVVERSSKEPQAVLVRAGDDPWLTLVRWVLYALVAAEEHGITRDNVRQRMADPATQRLLGGGAEVSLMLGVEPGWGERALLSAGNYGEMFERNLGRASPLKLERGLNNLWNKGGLMYAPPVR